MFINEPEWAIGTGGWLGDGVSLEAMLALVDETAAEIAARTRHPSTVGSASIEAAALLWVDRDLDLIQIHSYDGAALVTDAALITAAPCVVGELGTADNLTELEARGYGGVWLWSLRAEDDASALDLDAVAAWSAER